MVTLDNNYRQKDYNSLGYWQWLNEINLLCGVYVITAVKQQYHTSVHNRSGIKSSR